MRACPLWLLPDSPRKVGEPQLYHGPPPTRGHFLCLFAFSSVKSWENPFDHLTGTSCAFAWLRSSFLLAQKFLPGSESLVFLQLIFGTFSCIIVTKRLLCLFLQEKRSMEFYDKMQPDTGRTVQ